MQERDCEACGRPIRARKLTARKRFCDRVTCVRARARSRQRAHRADGPDLALVPPPGVEVPTQIPTMVEATRHLLEENGKLTSPLGVNAMILAARLDDPANDSASGLAALSRQHIAVLDAILDGADGAEDQLEKLRRQREERGQP